jgi:hypothetical protein
MLYVQISGKMTSLPQQEGSNMKLKLTSWLMVFGFALTACSGGPYVLNEDESLKAEAGARDYAERSGGKYISCSGQDSDKDGYVTCTVKVDAGTQDIACAYKTRGCKSKS